MLKRRSLVDNTELNPDWDLKLDSVFTVPDGLDPVKQNLSRTLDQLGDSIFNVGGSTSNPDEEGAVGGRNKDALDDDKFVERKRKEIEHLDRQFVSYNKQLDQMAVAKNQLAEERIQEGHLWEVRIRDLKAERNEWDRLLSEDHVKGLESRKSNAADLAAEREEVNRMTTRIQELTEEKDEKDDEVEELYQKRDKLIQSTQREVDENESVRNQIIESNRLLSEENVFRVKEVAEIEARKYALETYLAELETKCNTRYNEELEREKRRAVDKETAAREVAAREAAVREAAAKEAAARRATERGAAAKAPARPIGAPMRLLPTVASTPHVKEKKKAESNLAPGGDSTVPVKKVDHRVSFYPFQNNNANRHVDPSSIYRPNVDQNSQDARYTTSSGAGVQLEAVQEVWEEYPSDIGMYEGHTGGAGEGFTRNMGNPGDGGGHGQGTSGHQPQNVGNAPGGGDGQSYPQYQAQRTQNSAYNRRNPVSAAMQAVHNANPCIAGLGIDCSIRANDGSDILNWSLMQGNRLRGANNAARRVAKTPRPYNSCKPWKEEYQNFLDDMEASGWDKNESLPYLVGWLKEGPGRIAVDQWRTEYGHHGSFDELVACASYLFGSLAAEDPMGVFKKRAQKTHESYKVFGMELQMLLHQARPKWRYDDAYFIDELFMTFVEGLRDPEHEKVVWAAWDGDTSLSDLFKAIENFDKKRRLCGGRVPTSKISAFCEESRDDPNRGCEFPVEGEDVNIDAVRGDNKYSRSSGYRKDGSKWNSDARSGNSSYEKREYSRPAAAPVPVVTVPVASAPVVSQVPQVPVAGMVQSSLLEEIKLMIERGQMDRRPRRQRRDPMTPEELAEKTCYRCQGKGHMSNLCPAPKPVARGTVAAAVNQ